VSDLQEKEIADKSKACPRRREEKGRRNSAGRKGEKGDRKTLKRRYLALPLL